MREGLKLYSLTVTKGLQTLSNAIARTEEHLAEIDRLVLEEQFNSAAGITEFTHIVAELGHLNDLLATIMDGSGYVQQQIINTLLKKIGELSGRGE